MRCLPLNVCHSTRGGKLPLTSAPLSALSGCRHQDHPHCPALLCLLGSPPDFLFSLCFLLSTPDPIHPGGGETSADPAFCRGARTPGSLKCKPPGSHTSELPLQKASVHLPFMHSFIHSFGHLATQSANAGSAMLVGTVGGSKKYNTWSCFPRAYKLVDAVGDMNKRYKTEASKHWVWRVGEKRLEKEET